MLKQRSDFKVEVNGGNIRGYVTKPAIAQFYYSMEFELEKARLHANIDAITWQYLPASYIWMTDEHTYCKADYIALYRLSHRVESVASDVQSREIDKQRRQAKFNRGK